ncbi:MAG: type II secretion system F family protein [Candidatus Altiarchaeota archaeon]
MDEFVTKIAFPVIVGAIVFMLIGFAGIYFAELGGFYYFLPLSFLVFGGLIIMAYPQIVFEEKKADIHKNIHLFVTYMGSLSTLHLPRKEILRTAARREEYGETAKIIKRIIYLSDHWNLGLDKTCARMSGLVPSKILGNFLDRMAAALDFGESMEEFLLGEQNAVMTEYEGEYTEALKRLDVLNDVITSLVIAGAFMLSGTFLLPLIMGYSMYFLLAGSFLFMVFIDVMIIIVIGNFVTQDHILHQLPIKDEEFIKMKQSLYKTIPATAILFILAFILWYLDYVPLALGVSLSLLPLIYTGRLAKKQEATVLRRDYGYTSFIRSLGGSMSAKGGSLYGTLGPIRIHNYGVLNDLIQRLYMRLNIGADKVKAWMYFSGETGSEMIEKFSTIFIEVIRVGGDPKVASEIISKNFTRLMTVRELRLQMSGSFKGVYYGTILGLAGAAYASAEMSVLLQDTLSSTMGNLGSGAMEKVGSAGLDLFGIMDSSINLPLAKDVLFLILVVHAGLTALSIKVADGGNKYVALVDFVIMVWLVAIIALSLPYMFENMFGIGGEAEAAREIGTVGSL